MLSFLSLLHVELLIALLMFCFWPDYYNPYRRFVLLYACGESSCRVWQKVCVCVCVCVRGGVYALVRGACMMSFALHILCLVLVHVVPRDRIFDSTYTHTHTHTHAHAHTHTHTHTLLPHTTR